MIVDATTLIAAFNMPPEDAVAFLREKGLVVTDGWRELWQRAHDMAFTVAQSAGYDVLDDIREALIESMQAGTSFKQFADQITPILQAKGWWGRAIDYDTGEILKTYDGTLNPVMLGSPRRLRLIYDQNLQTAFMAGRYRGLRSAIKTHPYWEYFAVMDARTRPAHAALNGRVFRHDDPVWSVAYPPNGWRCRCRVIAVAAYRVADGDAIVSSGDGHIYEVEIPKRNGTVDKVKQIRLPNSKPFTPDVGWDYNPAEIF